MVKKISVREAERISRKIAFDKIRKREYMPDPEISDIEGRLQEALGTRVHIEKKNVGGQITIDFFTSEDLRIILDLVKSNKENKPSEMLDRYMTRTFDEDKKIHKENVKIQSMLENKIPEIIKDVEAESKEQQVEFSEDRAPEEIKQAEESKDESDIYSVKNFSL
jgi:hypothetical protein